MKKLHTILMALAVAISASAADYYLIGGFNGWTLKDASAKFTDKGDGTYVLDYAGTLTPDFKINDGTWNNPDANFGGSTKLELGVEYPLVVSATSGNIKMDGNVPNPHIVFNPTAKTLLITGQQQAITLAYGIHGQIFDGLEWATTAMTESNGKWSLTADVLPGEFGIKAMDSATGNQVSWISGVPEVEGVSPVLSVDHLGKAQAATEEGGANWVSTLEGNYTFTFDPAALTLTVTANAGIGSIATSAPVTYYNLQGIAVENPTSGLYIRVQGGKSTKVAL